jgi:hypothetical protein
VSRAADASDNLKKVAISVKDEVNSVEQL